MDSEISLQEIELIIPFHECLIQDYTKTLKALTQTLQPCKKVRHYESQNIQRRPKKSIGDKTTLCNFKFFIQKKKNDADYYENAHQSFCKSADPDTGPDIRGKAKLVNHGGK
jgi:hypothetical protein